MYELVLFGAGVTVGVLFKDQIVGFKARAKKAGEAALKAYKG